MARHPAAQRTARLARPAARHRASLRLGFSEVSGWLVFTYLWLPYMILPIFAGLERIPGSLLEASADLGGRHWTTFRRVILPLALPAVGGRLDLHVLADPRRLHHAAAGHGQPVHRQRDLQQRRAWPATSRSRPRTRIVPILIMARLPAASRAVRARSRRSDARVAGGLRLATLAVLAFLYVPIAVIFLYSFNGSRAQTWPIEELTTKWYAHGLPEPGRPGGLLAVDPGGHRRDAHRGGAGLARRARGASLPRSSGGTRSRSRWCCPSRCPGIITGIALAATIQGLGVGLQPAPRSSSATPRSAWSSSTTTPSHDCDGRRGPWRRRPWTWARTRCQTFRHVTLPVLATALLAGALLAFALSFDEIIVTNFTAGTEQTLPIWILSNIKLPNQRPIVNVVAVVVILLSAIPIYLAQRLAGSESPATRVSRRAPGWQRSGEVARRSMCHRNGARSGSAAGWRDGRSRSRPATPRRTRPMAGQGDQEQPCAGRRGRGGRRAAIRCPWLSIRVPL